MSSFNMLDGNTAASSTAPNTASNGDAPSAQSAAPAKREHPLHKIVETRNSAKSVNPTEEASAIADTAGSDPEISEAQSPSPEDAKSAKNKSQTIPKTRFDEVVGKYRDLERKHAASVAVKDQAIAYMKQDLAEAQAQLAAYQKNMRPEELERLQFAAEKKEWARRQELDNWRNQKSEEIHNDLESRYQAEAEERDTEERANEVLAIAKNYKALTAQEIAMYAHRNRMSYSDAAKVLDRQKREVYAAPKAPATTSIRGSTSTEPILKSKDPKERTRDWFTQNAINKGRV